MKSKILGTIFIVLGLYNQLFCDLKLVITLPEQNDTVTEIFWDKNNKQLFTASKDGVVKKWTFDSVWNYKSEDIINIVKNQGFLPEWLEYKLSINKGKSPFLMKMNAQTLLALSSDHNFFRYDKK